MTILVLGGLLLPAMLADGYRERFSIGLLTASGSLGLLFPLSLPLMLFSIVASSSRVEAPMEQLFVGGLVPGLVMLGLVALLGVRAALSSNAQRSAFDAGEALKASWNAKFELLLPVIVLGLYLSGMMTLPEASPVAALYALVVQRFIHRDLPTWKDVIRVMADCVALVGSILLILSVASGLTDYFVDARVHANPRRVDDGSYPLAHRVPAVPESVPAARRHRHGHLLGDHRGRAAESCPSRCSSAWIRCTSALSSSRTSSWASCTRHSA